jgi:protein-tyrosine phosphatase
MIDLHCHILPGIDDGASSTEDALAMLRICAEEGITHVVATPHAPIPAGSSPTMEELPCRVSELNQVAQSNGIAVTVLPGSEIRFESNVQSLLANGAVLPINGTSYLLLELPLVGEWPDFVRPTIYELQLAGYQPILAHVERYPSVQRDPSLLSDLIASGVLMQINAASVLNANDDRAGHTAVRLLQARMAHIIATDAHSPTSRAPRLRGAIERLPEFVEHDYADWIVSVSDQVIRGEFVVLPEPEIEQVRHWWARVWPGRTR